MLSFGASESKSVVVIIASLGADAGGSKKIGVNPELSIFESSQCASFQ